MIFKLKGASKLKNYKKYKIGYFLPPEKCIKWSEKDHITKPPIWCSVDLRDGNQALVVPMSLEEKLEFFNLLVKLGFKEIEVGFPAASETEYKFLRTLIERNLIPDDVLIQVLTQSREHIIKRTFEALKGAKQAIVHLYNSTSVAQRELVFKKSKEEIIQLATGGAKLVKQLASETSGNFKFEYSPESFTGTEMEFALDICNAVLDVFKPTENNKVIINLPVTVSLSMPHVYASQVEYIGKNLKYREDVILSLHPHNDRGCAIADCELGLLAGAERVEGTLFGNGERTGNVDIVTLALNMFSQGVDPNLDLENLPDIVKHYEEATGMRVYERQPYSGDLVFAAFSGSHQDAIAKAMNWRKERNSEIWNVPYLLIDPKDVGRKYESNVIRINSQSGKGGIEYLLENRFSLKLPVAMREEFGYVVKNVSDKLHKELLPEEIYEIFNKEYVNLNSKLDLVDYYFTKNKTFNASVIALINGNEVEMQGSGNGGLDAVNNALKSKLNIDYQISKYEEHALDKGSTSRAVAYVGIKDKDNKLVWGVGIHTDIVTASILGLFSAVNKILQKKR